MPIKIINSLKLDSKSFIIWHEIELSYTFKIKKQLKTYV